MHLMHLITPFPDNSTIFPRRYYFQDISCQQPPQIINKIKNKIKKKKIPLFSQLKNHFHQFYKHKCLFK